MLTNLFLSSGCPIHLKQRGTDARQASPRRKQCATPRFFRSRPPGKHTGRGANAGVCSQLCRSTPSCLFSRWGRNGLGAHYWPAYLPSSSRHKLLPYRVRGTLHPQGWGPGAGKPELNTKFNIAILTFSMDVYFPTESPGKVDASQPKLHRKSVQ